MITTVPLIPTALTRVHLGVLFCCCLLLLSNHAEKNSYLYMVQSLPIVPSLWFWQSPRMKSWSFFAHLITRRRLAWNCVSLVNGKRYCLRANYIELSFGRLNICFTAGDLYAFFHTHCLWNTQLSALRGTQKMTVLKRIPKVLSPRLLHVLASMGHGDEIVLAGASGPIENSDVVWTKDCLTRKKNAGSKSNYLRHWCFPFLKK